MKKLLFTLIIISISSQILVAQNLNHANHLFEKRAYLDAAELFLNEENKTQDIHEKLGDCFYFNNKMTKAAQWYKKLLHKYEDNTNPTYFYRYSQALKGIENFKEADKWLQKYNDNKQFKTANNLETLSFFESLNKTIKRPYIIHKVSGNSEGSDFGISFYGNNKVVFASTREPGELYNWNKQPYLDLYQGDLNETNDIINVVPFSEKVNTKMHESNAVFTKDGKTMFFTRNNFIAGKKRFDENKVTHLKIYKAILINDTWTNITELPFNGDNYSVEHPALSFDEKQLYFASDMPGSIGSFDLFVVDINDNGTYSDPKNLGTKINTEQREQFPFISTSNTLYFASNGHFGLGGLDIFKSEISNGNFSTPLNLSNIINSNSDDFGFIFDEEKEFGYFSSNREGGIGDDDIYRFTKTKNFIKGVVQDKTSLELIPGALVALFDDKNSSIAETIVGDDASYSFEIVNNSDYIIKGTRKLYIPIEIKFSVDNKGNINKDILLNLQSYEDAEKDIVVERGQTQIKINPIYFNFDKWDIRSDAALELDNVVGILNKYTDMKIEIGTHTDCRGSDTYNLFLSQKRATSVKKYLESKGISEDRVNSIGYGEKQPVNHCIKEGICKEDEYDINRRCEFIILN